MRKPWKQDAFGAVIWSEEAFHQLAVEPLHWEAEAKNLWSASRILSMYASEPTDYARQQLVNVNMECVAQMLRGMGLECLLKSIYFHRRIQEEGGDRLKVGRFLGTHDIFKLARRELRRLSPPVNLDADQRKRLKLMGKMIVSNRYHVDSREGQESIGKQAAIGVLADEDLWQLFMRIREGQKNSLKSAAPNS